MPSPQLYDNVTSIFLGENCEPSSAILLQKWIELLRHNQINDILTEESSKQSQLLYNTYVKDGCQQQERSSD